MADRVRYRSRRWSDRRWWDDISWWSLALLVAMVGVVILAIVIGVREHQAKAKCEDNGGRVVEYNCRTVCTMTGKIFTCSEHCDWRCEGANAEDAR